MTQRTLGDRTKASNLLLRLPPPILSQNSVGVSRISTQCQERERERALRSVDLAYVTFLQK